MSGITIVFIGFLAICFLLIVIYNTLVRKRNDVENAFGGMDAQLKKRYDLIPNLVAAVKQYMRHERDLLEKITALRSQAINAPDAENKVALDNQIAGAMKQLMIAVENYPDLKSNTNFLNLQRTLNEVESQISASRRAYNAAVTDYNNSVETFPSNVIAGMFDFSRKQVFEIEEVERQNINVDSLFNS